MEWNSPTLGGKKIPSAAARSTSGANPGRFFSYHDVIHAEFPSLEGQQESATQACNLKI